MKSLDNLMICQNDESDLALFYTQQADVAHDLHQYFSVLLGVKLAPVEHKCLNDTFPFCFYQFTVEAKDINRLPECLSAEFSNFVTTKPYLAKSLRLDTLCYLTSFFPGITKSPRYDHKTPTRMKPKLAFTVKGDGVHERATKQPQYSVEEKRFFSGHQSTSVIVPSVQAKLFGNDAKTKLIGIIIEEKDALINRAFLYDYGTYNRPYDFLSREEAEAYYQEKTNPRNRILYTDLAALKSAISSGTIAPGTFNEVLARLRWNCDGTSKIIIFNDELPCRLAAQEAARLLKIELQRQAEDFRKTPELALAVTQQGLTLFSADYEIPIYFYNSSANRENIAMLGGYNPHFRKYNQLQQAYDRGEALKLCMDETLWAEQFEKEDFEFLLFHPDPLAVFLKPYQGCPFYQYLLNKKYCSLVVSFLKRCISIPELERKINIPALAQQLWQHFNIDIGLVEFLFYQQWIKPETRLHEIPPPPPSLNILKDDKHPFPLRFAPPVPTTALEFAVGHKYWALVEVMLSTMVSQTIGIDFHNILTLAQYDNKPTIVEKLRALGVT